MMKTVKWHEECLKNRKISLNKKKARLLEMKAEISRDERDVVFYEYQIELAKTKNKDGFDVERFGVKRGGRG